MKKLILLFICYAVTDCSEERKIEHLYGFQNITANFVLSNNGLFLAGGGWAGAVKIWDLKTKNIMATIVVPEQEIENKKEYPADEYIIGSILFSPKGDKLYISYGHKSTDKENKLLVWDAEKSKIEKIISKDTGYIFCMALMENDKVLVTARANGLDFWETDTMKKIYALNHDYDISSGFVIDKAENFLYQGTRESELIQVDLKKKKIKEIHRYSEAGTIERIEGRYEAAPLESLTIDNKGKILAFRL